MATFEFFGTARYYDGVTTGRDQDGVLVYSQDPDSDGYSSGLVRATAFFERLHTYGDGTTTGNDQDGDIVGTGIDGLATQIFSATENRLPRLAKGLVTYTDGVTAGKDQDGAPLFDALEEDTHEYSPLYSSVRVASAVEGTASTSAAASVYMLAETSVSGSASITAGALVRRPASASVSGSASVSADASLIKTAEGTSDNYCIAAAEAVQAVVDNPLPGLSRAFYSGEVAVLMDVGVVSSKGDSSVSNTLRVSSESTLERNPAYSGVDYLFGGPADSLSTPKKLGFRKGDKLRLVGSTGSELNHGKVVTFEDPDDLSIMESLSVPDSEFYEFEAFRRLP